MSTSDTPDFIRRFRERMAADDLIRNRSPRRIRSQSLVHRGKEVGRGGLGVVYSYYDNTLKREVAVKVANKRVLQNAEKLDRFDREYRLTAQLQHPGIPAVYGSGVLRDGRPFYVMRLLVGRPLAELILEVHRNSGNCYTSSNTGFQQLLSSLLICCDAVSFAHQRGIVHRDIKPGNIVVEPDGATFVIDWGMAAIRDLRTKEGKEPVTATVVDRPIPTPLTYSQTDAGRFMGTPAYMSPEQADGDPSKHDETTDVYGLGATLFHILSGRAPHELETQSIAAKSPNTSWRDTIKELAQPSVERFPNDAPRELVSICRKAMSTSQADRYEDVRSLANDLRRWQRREIVEAHRPQYRWTDRIWVFVQKHRRWVLSSLVILIGLTLASIVSVFFITNARSRELAQLRREESANDLLLEGMEEWSEFVMQDQMLASESFQPLRLQMLDKLLVHYQRWVTENAEGSQESLQRAVHGLLQLGRIHEQSGRSEAALIAFRQAKDFADLLPAETFVDGTIEILGKELALVQSKLGSAEQAEHVLRDVLRKLHSRGYLQDREALTADLLHTVAALHINQADDQADWGTRSQFYLDAIDDLNEEVRIWQTLLKQQANFRTQMGLVSALNAKALCQHKAVSTSEAIATYNDALSLLAQMQLTFSDEASQEKILSRQASIKLSMGMSFLLLRDIESGEAAYITAINIYKHFRERYPLVLRYREELARGWGNLADLYAELDGHENEIHARQQAIDLARALRMEHPQVQVHAEREILHSVRLCFCLHQNGRTGEAGKLFSSLLQEHTTPEEVEPLNPSQRFKCAMGYLLAAEESPEDDGSPDLQLSTREALRNRAIRIVLDIPVELYGKAPVLQKLLVDAPVFEPIRNSNDQNMRVLLDHIKASQP